MEVAILFTKSKQRFRYFSAKLRAPKPALVQQFRPIAAFEQTIANPMISIILPEISRYLPKKKEKFARTF